MIIFTMLVIIYMIYFLEKTKILKKLGDKKKYSVYFFLILLSFLDTQITLFKFSFNFLIVGIIIVLFEVALKKLKIVTNYLFFKIYFVILTVLLLYRSGIWILQKL